MASTSISSLSVKGGEKPGSALNLRCWLGFLIVFFWAFNPIQSKAFNRLPMAILLHGNQSYAMVKHSMPGKSEDIPVFHEPKEMEKAQISLANVISKVKVDLRSPGKAINWHCALWQQGLAQRHVGKQPYIGFGPGEAAPRLRYQRLASAIVSKLRQDRKCPKSVHECGKGLGLKSQSGALSIDEIRISNSGSFGTFGSSFSSQFGSQQQPAIVPNQQKGKGQHDDRRGRLNNRANNRGVLIPMAWLIGWILFGSLLGFWGWILLVERGRHIIGGALFLLAPLCGGFGVWSLLYWF